MFKETLNTTPGGTNNEDSKNIFKGIGIFSHHLSL